MKSVTVDQIMKMNPCSGYTRERVEELRKSVCGRRKKITAYDIAKTDIYFRDKFWILFRNEFFTDRQLHKIGIYSAEKIALPIWEKYYPNDNRPREAIRVKKLWLKGKATHEELEKARMDAYAAYTAVYTAAHTAAHTAVYAAYHAAYTAGYGAYTAGYGAGYDAVACKKIIRYALKLCKEEK